jgi:hypothetical protein
MRRKRGRGRTRRLRAGLVTLLSGGAGFRPVAERPPARSSLTVIGSAGRVGLMARQAVEANWRQKTERHAKS